MKFIALLKRNLLTILFTSFLIFLVVFSNNNLIAAKEGLTLWATCVVPSLLPFFIATELLNYTNIAQILGRLLHPIMKPIFNVPGEGAYALIMGFISGYPVGAKIVSDMYSNGRITKDEAERMLCFTNNSGPLFIIGTVGILLFGNTNIGILLLITHILSGITIGFILSIISRVVTRLNSSSSKKHSNTLYGKNFHASIDSALNSNNVSSKQKYTQSCTKTTSSIAELGNILGTSISNAISTIMLIGGFVLLFSVILSILNRLNLITFVSNFLTKFHIPYDISKSFISGIIELTNGVSSAANIHSKNLSTNIILSAFLLGFGGFSILLQVLSIINKHGLSIKTYFFGKIMQGLIAALYTLLLVKNISIFNFDIPSITTTSSNYALTFLLIVLICIFTLFMFNVQKKSNEHKINYT